MADERFQDFPQKTNPSGSDELVGVDGSGYFRAPVSSLPSGGGGGGSAASGLTNPIRVTVSSHSGSAGVFDMGSCVALDKAVTPQNYSGLRDGNRYPLVVSYSDTAEADFEHCYALWDATAETFTRTYSLTSEVNWDGSDVVVEVAMTALEISEINTAVSMFPEAGPGEVLIIGGSGQSEMVNTLGLGAYTDGNTVPAWYNNADVWDYNVINFVTGLYQVTDATATNRQGGLGYNCNSLGHIGHAFACRLQMATGATIVTCWGGRAATGFYSDQYGWVYDVTGQNSGRSGRIWAAGAQDTLTRAISQFSLDSDTKFDLTIFSQGGSDALGEPSVNGGLPTDAASWAYGVAQHYLDQRSESRYDIADSSTKFMVVDVPPVVKEWEPAWLGAAASVAEQVGNNCIVVDMNNVDMDPQTQGAGTQFPLHATGQGRDEVSYNMLKAYAYNSPSQSGGGSGASARPRFRDTGVISADEPWGCWFSGFTDTAPAASVASITVDKTKLRISSIWALNIFLPQSSAFLQTMRAGVLCTIEDAVNPASNYIKFVLSSDAKRTAGTDYWEFDGEVTQEQGNVLTGTLANVVRFDHPVFSSYEPVIGTDLDTINYGTASFMPAPPGVSSMSDGAGRINDATEEAGGNKLNLIYPAEPAYWDSTGVQFRRRAPMSFAFEYVAVQSIGTTGAVSITMPQEDSMVLIDLTIAMVAENTAVMAHKKGSVVLRRSSDVNTVVDVVDNKTFDYNAGVNYNTVCFGCIIVGGLPNITIPNGLSFGDVSDPDYTFSITGTATRLY